MVFGPHPDGTVPSLAEVRAHLDARLHLLPRYRRRLAGTGPGTLTWQHWEEDPHFDIARHVLPGVLPDPGGWEELLEWAGDFYSARLDRTMPLWQVTVVNGLGDGHWALVTKTHHCLVDGVGAVDATHLLLDGVAHALGVAELPDPAAAPAGLRQWVAPVLRPILGAAHLAVHPLDLARRAAALAELVVREEVIGAPDSGLNGPIGPRRRLRGVTFELDEARDIRRAFNGTVNDVVLAGACAGLRELLLARGEDLPVLGVRAMVPMNIRREGEQLGNHISSLFVDLPVDEPNPQFRYELIREASASLKRGNLPLGADTLLQLGGLAPPLVHRVVAQALSGKRLFNLTITNVPGPPVAMTALDAPLTSVWPLVPLAADHTVAIAVLSYAGSLMFGVCGDHEAVPDIDVLALGIARGLEELHSVAVAAAGRPA